MSSRLGGRRKDNEKDSRGSNGSNNDIVYYSYKRYFELFCSNCSISIRCNTYCVITPSSSDTGSKGESGIAGDRLHPSSQRRACRRRPASPGCGCKPGEHRPHPLQRHGGQRLLQPHQPRRSERLHPPRPVGYPLFLGW